MIKEGISLRRLTRAERAAAAAVLTAAASVAGTGITLLQRHSRLMAQKAAAMFREDENEKDSEAEVNKKEES